MFGRNKKKGVLDKYKLHSGPKTVFQTKDNKIYTLVDYVLYIDGEAQAGEVTHVIGLPDNDDYMPTMLLRRNMDPLEHNQKHLNKFVAEQGSRPAGGRRVLFLFADGGFHITTALKKDPKTGDKVDLMKFAEKDNLNELKK
jgi:hypothetical protein